MNKDCMYCNMSIPIPTEEHVDVGELFVWHLGGHGEKKEKNKDWRKRLMDEFCVTFERAQDESVVQRLEDFIEQLLKEEREEAYKKGFIDGGIENLKA